MDIGEVNPADLPWGYSEGLGDVMKAECMCPGVYYVATYGGTAGDTEFYVVKNNAEAISEKAKSYGKILDEGSDWLIFLINEEKSGKRIIEYEVQRYYVKQHNSLARKNELREISAYGQEEYPEYFGKYSIPTNTPCGHVVKYKTLLNGIFWAETDTTEEIIIVKYPLWQDAFSPYVMRYAIAINDDDKTRVANGNVDICFSKHITPVVILELQRRYAEIKRSDYINNEALMNIIFRDFPQYAIIYNLTEQAGASDTLGLLLSALGFDVELHSRTDNTISINENAGFNYLILDNTE